MVTTPRDVSDPGLVRVDIAGQEILAGMFKKAAETTADMRPIFGLIMRSQFKFQRQIFQLGTGPFSIASGTGRGRYKDLAPRTKERKRKKIGQVYPILLFSGRLKSSLLTPGGDNVLKIRRKFAEYGTRVPYAVYHQSNRPRKRKPTGEFRLPRRPFLFVDDQRLRAWRGTIAVNMRKPFKEAAMKSKAKV